MHHTNACKSFYTYYDCKHWRLLLLNECHEKSKIRQGIYKRTDIQDDKKDSIQDVVFNLDSMHIRQADFTYFLDKQFPIHTNNTLKPKSFNKLKKYKRILAYSSQLSRWDDDSRNCEYLMGMSSHTIANKCVYIYLNLCVYVYQNIYVHTCFNFHVCVHVYLYICVCICVYTWICFYICTYSYMQM